VNVAKNLKTFKGGTTFVEVMEATTVLA